MPSQRSAFGLLVALFTLLTTSATAEARRIALVIGNASYTSASALSNPVNDARDMAQIFRGFGFEVVEGLDLDKPSMRQTVRRFVDQLAGAEAAVLFYSGHGLQVAGQNYLIPVDAELAREEDIGREAVRLDEVIAAMERAAKATIVFLDACRNNPLAQSLSRSLSGRSGELGRGLAPVQTANLGTFISFATAPNTIALDGDGANSPYTDALKRHITTPGRDLGAIMINVRNDVIRATRERQIPWESSSLRSQFYFAPAAGAGPAGDPCPAPGVPLTTAKGRSCLPPGARFKDCETCPELIVIPRGTFLMGTDPGEPDRYDDEGPRHRVSMAAFATGVSHVTRQEYSAFMSATGYAPGRGCHELAGTTWRNSAERSWTDPGFPQNDHHPAVCLSWVDAGAYVRWLSTTTGRTYRLLTEAEAEYIAAAIGSDVPPSTYPFGNSAADLCRFANGADESARSAYPSLTVAPCRDGHVHTAPVRQFAANAFGVHDAIGNVWTWAADCYVAGYRTAPANGSAVEREACEERVLRGGSWYDPPRDLRTANRSRFAPNNRFTHVGLRVVRALD